MSNANMVVNVSSILSTMALVNSYFQNGNPVANNDWTGGTYMQGNMAHYRASANTSLLDYAVNWGESHAWEPAGYRGCDGKLGCPDNICCGQGFAEIYELKKDPKMIASILAAVESAETCDAQTNSSQTHDSNSCWWWVDALFMALPTYAHLGAIVGESAGADIWTKARRQYNITAFGVNTSGAPLFKLWSPQDNLFYRDDSYISSVAPNGAKVFWARGNGWAFAAMARALRHLPTSPDRTEYESKLVAMASKLVEIQGKDGCWRPSLEDPEEFPVIETTGTSLFVYGLAWGVNNGLLLPATKYHDAAMKGWACLNNPWPTGAVRETDGLLGWCQPGGASPQGNFNASSTSDFCVGTFLLAGSEVANL